MRNTIICVNIFLYIVLSQYFTSHSFIKSLKPLGNNLSIYQQTSLTIRNPTVSKVGKISKYIFQLWKHCSLQEKHERFTEITVFLFTTKFPFIVFIWKQQSQRNTWLDNLLRYSSYQHECLNTRRQQSVLYLIKHGLRVF